MRTVAGELARGRWVHIFPEGRVNYTGVMGPLRWGVGKLVCDARARSASGKEDPVVLPFYHSGMGHVMPKRAVVPRPGSRVHVVVGQPVDISDLTCRWGCGEGQGGPCHAMRVGGRAGGGWSSMPAEGRGERKAG